MKKSIIFCTFLLCVGFVGAQSLHMSESYPMRGVQRASSSIPTPCSFFTKSDRVIKHVDFSADSFGYSTGVITTGSETHTQTAPYSFWHRWADDSDSTLSSAAALYSALASNYFGSSDNFVTYMRRYIDSARSSAENGWMMMSLYDQRTVNTGNFNAYIQIDSIDASSAALVEVTFFQYCRPYYDHYYIDYCTDGITWNEMEINARSSMPIEFDGTIWGFSTYSLPPDAAGCPNLSVRLRCKSLDSDHPAYGYFWIVDDLSIIAADSNRMTQYGQEFVEGNYGQIPQGMTINPAWYTMVRNTGSVNQSDVTATLYHLDAAQDNTTLVATYNNGAVGVGNTKALICDPAGWLNRDYLDYRGWYGMLETDSVHGTGMAMPTATVGDNYLFATASNSNLMLSYDTMFYQVNGADANGNYTWAHDNGVLTYSPYNYWMYGFVYSGGNWYVTEDPDEVHYYGPGYSVTSRYTTGASVPEGWVIKGVELVASPVDGFHSVGAKVSAVLMQDEYDGEDVDFIPLNTGANVKTIASADVNDSNVIGRNSNGYLVSDYNTVYIPFPEQPALEANTSYRIGYKMEEEGHFALASEATGSYRIASPSRPDTYDTIIYFANNPATAKYAHYYAPNRYQNFIQDPGTGMENNAAYAQFVESNPMIRMLVGPAVAMERKTISVECENAEFGEVTYLNQSVCGTDITPAVSSSCKIQAVPQSGYHASVIVDGTACQPWNQAEGTGDPNLKIKTVDNTYSYSYTFSDIQDNHTIRFVFAEGLLAIDPLAADVRMRLLPNPATEQVVLHVEGVSGMVDCAILDMSGRMVYTQRVDAERTHTIDLTPLAKGTYFVRLTNAQFTKVDKLIVR